MQGRAREKQAAGRREEAQARRQLRLVGLEAVALVDDEVAPARDPPQQRGVADGALVGRHDDAEATGAGGVRAPPSALACAAASVDEAGEQSGALALVRAVVEVHALRDARREGLRICAPVVQHGERDDDEVRAELAVLLGEVREEGEDLERLAEALRTRGGGAWGGRGRAAI